MISLPAAPVVVLLRSSGGRREAGFPLRAAHSRVVQQQPGVPKRADVQRGRAGQLDDQPVVGLGASRRKVILLFIFPSCA